MAEDGRFAAEGRESDPHARIQARIAQRRSDRAASSATPGSAAPGSVPTARKRRRRPAHAQRRPSRISRLARTLAFLLAVAVVVVSLRHFVVASYYIPSGSMEPTLHGCKHCEPDLVLVDRLSYRFSSVARSDVVVFDRPPLAPPEDSQLIKRVIGLPGETVSGHDGKVFIGARALPEPYVNPACHGTGDFAAVKVPAGKYFVMGDNRCDSLDSRVFGVIAGSSIVGRSVAVSWPLKHLRWL
ncbi:signal peptidase I [Jatrophihabitans sp.]|uniref:signal peptidase I n=1 Tax=Jatrophihabitans sp. TaxID=1932789 RepID=UPI002F2122C2